MFQNWPNHNEFAAQATITFPHHDNAEQVLVSAQIGCSLCKLLSAESVKKPISNKQSSEAAGFAQGYVKVSVLDWAEDGDNSGPLRLRLCYIVEAPNSESDAHEAKFTSPGTSVEMVKSDQWVDMTPRAEATDMRSTLSQVCQWFLNCSSSHGLCGQAEKLFKPRRLIYLGSECPALRLAEDIKGFPKYATLSYCWGSLKFETLRKSNLAQFQKRIPHQALLKTFREAFDVAKQLNLDYIWVGVDDCVLMPPDNQPRNR